MTERKVGLFLMSEDNAHQVANRLAAEGRARALGLDLEVFSAGSVAAQQSQDVVRFLYANEGRELCIVIMPVSDVDSSQGAVEDHPLHKLAYRAVSRRAGWITLNRDAEAMVASLQKEFPEVPVGSVTPDQKEIGRIQGRQFRHLLPRGGRILYVVGNPFVSSSRDRRTGMLEQVARFPDLAVDEIDGFWSADVAKAAVSKWLATASGRGDWPALVGCQNDEMARGVSEELAEAARRYNNPALARIPITGIDGLGDQGQKWVRDRKLAATVVLPTTADVAIDQLAHAWKTRSRLPLKTVVPVTPFPADSV